MKRTVLLLLSFILTLFGVSAVDTLDTATTRFYGKLADSSTTSSGNATLTIVPVETWTHTYADENEEYKLFSWSLESSNYRNADKLEFAIDGALVCQSESSATWDYTLDIRQLPSQMSFGGKSYALSFVNNGDFKTNGLSHGFRNDSWIEFYETGKDNNSWALFFDFTSLSSKSNDGINDYFYATLDSNGAQDVTIKFFPRYYSSKSSDYRFNKFTDDKINLNGGSFSVIRSGYGYVKLGPTPDTAGTYTATITVTLSSGA